MWVGGGGWVTHGRPRSLTIVISAACRKQNDLLEGLCTCLFFATKSTVSTTKPGRTNNRIIKASLMKEKRVITAVQ